MVQPFKDKSNRRVVLALYALMFLPGLWAGLVLGLAFIETPLKFQAPGMTTPLALGVGRLVFWALNICELILCGVLLGSCWIVRQKLDTTIHYVVVAMLILIVILQTTVLLPTLRVRTDSIIAGQAVGSSTLHMLYAVIEACKFPLLLAIFIFAVGWHAKHVGKRVT